MLQTWFVSYTNRRPSARVGGLRLERFDYQKEEAAMKKVTLLAAMILLFWSSPLPVFSEHLVTRQKAENEWEMLNNKGDVVGRFERTEKGNYKFYNRSGQYVGLIIGSEKWIPRDARRSYTTITPEDAQLYLDVLRIIKTIK
jgi:hypothetical protein